jgi:membrane-associated phospholipid phosphatase
MPVPFLVQLTIPVIQVLLMAFLLLPGLHNWFLAHVKSGTSAVIQMQALRNRPMDRFFLICAFMGTEVSYFLLLPCIFWNIDKAVGRKLMTMWAVGFYVANYLKDLLLLPRPFEVSDRVDTVEGSRDRFGSTSGYGLPSVRAFSATALPFYVVMLTHSHMDYSIAVGLSTALFWLSLIALSRLYLGSNSPAGVMAGMVLGGLFVGVWMLIGDLLDTLLTSPVSWVPYLQPLVSFLLLMAYPIPFRFTRAFVDTGPPLPVYAIHFNPRIP